MANSGKWHTSEQVVCELGQADWMLAGGGDVARCARRDCGWTGDARRGWGGGGGGLGGWGGWWGVVERSWVCVVSLVCPSRCTIRWRNQYGGLKADDAKRVEELEKQNVMLKRLLAEAELEKAVLKELAGGNF